MTRRDFIEQSWADRDTYLEGRDYGEDPVAVVTLKAFVALIRHRCLDLTLTDHVTGKVFREVCRELNL